jgi:Tol biopolymer transport system component
MLAGLVTSIVAAPSSATFPGTNGRIAFSAFRERTDSLEIFTATRDGGDVRKLTSNPGHFSVTPDWSPDGQRIAFDRRTFAGGKRVGQIYLMNADGSALARLTRGPGLHANPSWSPDASSLAIRTSWGAGRALRGIWIIPASDPDGVTVEDARRLTSVPAGVKFDAEPQYSPDGSSIVFTRFKTARRSAIHRINVDGTGLERLTPWRLNASDPDWSPDGERIAFDSGDFGGRTGGGGNIYVMRADGGGRTRLTDRPRFRAGERFDVVNNPVWSPSGTNIMYTHFLPERGVLAVMKADGSDKHVVLDRPRFANKVDWGTHP